MHLLPHALKVRVKRWRWARQQRNIEASAYQCAPAPTWSRIRRMNDIAGVWHRRPEHRTATHQGDV